MNEYFSNSRKALLQKLVERVLLPSDDTYPSPVELFIGQLPPDLLFTPPLPAHNQFYGSHRISFDVVEVLFDTPLPPTELIHFYQEQLEESGWYKYENRYKQRERGFITTASPGLGVDVHFCRGPQGPSLNIFALKEPEGSTQVRLYLNTNQDDSPCKSLPEPDSRLSGWIALNLFPRLTPPIGAQHMEVGNQSTRDFAMTTALLETEKEIPLPILANHYAAQLEQAGWQQTSEKSNNQFAWHTWFFRDDEKNKEWQALILLIKIPNSYNRFYLNGYLNASPLR